MNRSIASLNFLALAAFAAIGSHAHADDITVDPTPFVSTKSRAEVVAELQAYKAAGVNPWANHYNPLGTFRSTQARAQVQAAYLSSREAVAAMNGEDSGARFLSMAARQPQPVVVAAQSDEPRQ